MAVHRGDRPGSSDGNHYLRAASQVLQSRSSECTKIAPCKGTKPALLLLQVLPTSPGRGFTDSYAIQSRCSSLGRIKARMGAFAYPLQRECVGRQHACVRPRWEAWLVRMRSSSLKTIQVEFVVSCRPKGCHALAGCAGCAFFSRPHRVRLIVSTFQPLWLVSEELVCFWHGSALFNTLVCCRTQSEVVVPVITRGGDLLGVLDVDSDLPAVFTDAGIARQ